MRRILIYHDFPERHRLRLEAASPGYQVIVCTDRKTFFELLDETEILITFKIDPETLDRAPRLKWVQALTAGIDTFPVDRIRARGIVLTTGKGIHKIHMAEYALAAMILLARNFHRMFRNQLQAKWDRKIPQGEIHGKVLGILGLGSIGLEIARKAHFFGMRVLGVRKNPAPADPVEKVYGMSGMAEVFEKADYLINLLPLTPETRRIIDKALFARMNENAFFINLGRGGTVHQEDLIDALASGRMAGLVADIFEEEPLPPESRLWTLENVILTPHISGVSPAYIDRAMEIIEHNLRVYRDHRGEMINRMGEDADY